MTLSPKALVLFEKVQEDPDAMIPVPLRQKLEACISDRGLGATDHLSPEEFIYLGIVIKAYYRHLHWSWVDWIWRFVNGFGELGAQFPLEQFTGLNHDRIEQLCRVVDKWPKSDRYYDLSITAYQEAGRAVLTPQQRHEILEAAVSTGETTTGEIRESVQKLVDKHSVTGCLVNVTDDAFELAPPDGNTIHFKRHPKLNIRTKLEIGKDVDVTYTQKDGVFIAKEVRAVRIEPTKFLWSGTGREIAAKLADLAEEFDDPENVLRLFIISIESRIDTQTKSS